MTAFSASAEVEEAEGCGYDAGEAEGHSEVPVAALAGEQGDGGDDEADFEEGLAEVEAIAAALRFMNLCFILAGGGFGFSQVLIPLLQMVFVTVRDLIR
jgi:hypothetical protein